MEQSLKKRLIWDPWIGKTFGDELFSCSDNAEKYYCCQEDR